METSSRDDLPRATDSAVEEQAAAWFLRLNADECTDEDRRKFDTWLGASERHEAEYRAFLRLWQRLDGLADTGLPARKRRKSTGLPGLLAAFAVGAGIFFSALRPAVTEQTIATAIGETRHATLSDGSVVDVNANSRIVIAFSDGARRIRVEQGEAVFVVAADPTRPFEVSAGAGTLRDIGTTFGVALTNNEASVSVIEGAVEIRLADGGARAVVSGGERARYAERHISPPERFDAEAVTAWRTGRFIFHNTPLDDVVRQMNLHHGRRTELGDPALERLRVSGVFNIADRDGLLAALEILYPLRRDDGGASTRLLPKQK